MISRFYLLFTLVALGMLPAGAQNNAAAASYFRTMGADVTATDLYFSSNDKDKSISVLNGVRSNLYNGKGAGMLTFYTISKGPDGKQLDTPMAQADISKAGTLALLIFSPDPATPGHYAVEVLPDDMTTFPLGSYRIINRSPQTVKVVLGHQITNVAPNDIQLVIYPPPTGRSTVPARIYASSGDNIQKLLYADTWSYNNQFRTEILINRKEGPQHFLSVVRLLDNPTTLLLKQYLPQD